MRDLKDLKLSKLIASSELGKFVKMVEMEEHVVYVYEHECYCSFSTMTFVSMATLTEVVEMKNILIGCSEHTDTTIFYYFFMEMAN